MKDMLPSELSKTLPPLHSQDGIADPIVHVCLLDGAVGWIWYIIEGSPYGKDFVFFGFIIGPGLTWGTFSLSVLAEAAEISGQPIVRDLQFEPQPVSRVMGEGNGSAASLEGFTMESQEYVDRPGVELTSPEAPSHKIGRLSMKFKFTIAGFVCGAVVGFLVRPNVPLIGQLPFGAVITRGANLHGLNQLLIGYARTSFNYLIAGMVLGTVIGLIAAFAISRQRSDGATPRLR